MGCGIIGTIRQTNPTDSGHCQQNKLSTPTTEAMRRGYKKQFSWILEQKFIHITVSHSSANAASPNVSACTKNPLHPGPCSWRTGFP